MAPKLVGTPAWLLDDPDRGNRYHSPAVALRTVDGGSAAAVASLRRSRDLGATSRPPIVRRVFTVGPMGHMTGDRVLRGNKIEERAPVASFDYDQTGTAAGLAEASPAAFRVPTQPGDDSALRVR